jgi:hypothetical protein
VKNPGRGLSLWRCRAVLISTQRPDLAKLIACRINLGERDPRKIRDGALTELQLKK